MKLFCLTLFIIPCCLPCFAQQQLPQYTKDDTLHWCKDRKLIWADFQGVPDTNSIGMAGTLSNFVTKSRYTSDTTISVIITAVFYKQKSWVKNKCKDSATLNHEQGHFDITEIYARKATAAFKKYKYNKATVNKDIDSIFNYYFEDMERMDDLYDKETTKPISNSKQKIWDKKIAVWLRKSDK